MRLLLIVISVLAAVDALDNGLGLTPPMGFNSWQRFRCNTDCKTDPKFCISENLYKEIADAMVEKGFKDAGYEYVNMDDCWLLHERDAKGRLQADPDRFPSGIKALADYIHGKGLKFGIYEDFGVRTCGGYAGSEFYLETDARTFAEWEVDYLKFDGCNSDPKDMPFGYPAMTFFLNKTMRPIFFSCEWPLYQIGQKVKPDYGAIANACNIWRNYNDVQDSWDSIVSILEFYGKDEGNFSAYAGPGHFNDPDMLVVGDFSLSYTQQRVQFGMWAMMASPLLISDDIRTINLASQQLLLNRRIIAVNQDKLGNQAVMLQRNGNMMLWKKSILPTGSYAFAVVNLGTGGVPLGFMVMGSTLGLTSANGYNVTEAFDGTHVGKLLPSGNITVMVDPSGIFMATLVPFK